MQSRKCKLETELTEEDRDILDKLVRVSKLRNKVTGEVARAKENLENCSELLGVVDEAYNNARSKVRDKGLEENYRRLCYMHGLSRGG